MSDSPYPYRTGSPRFCSSPTLRIGRRTIRVSGMSEAMTIVGKVLFRRRFMDAVESECVSFGKAVFFVK